jgi:hypothetical protein
MLNGPIHSRERCCFIMGATALHEQTILNRFIDVTSCRSSGSMTPHLDEPRSHCLDRLVVPDTDLDPQSSRPLPQSRPPRSVRTP